MSNLPFFIAILTIPVLALFAEGTTQESSSAKPQMVAEQTLATEQDSSKSIRGDYQILVTRDQQDTFILTFNLMNFVSEDKIISCQWNFGDGETGVTPEILHRYTSPGVYNVDLSIVERNGSEYSFTTKIHVPDEKWQENTASSNQQSRRNSFL